MHGVRVRANRKAKLIVGVSQKGLNKRMNHGGGCLEGKNGTWNRADFTI